jgi:hypothetical protein
MGKRLELVGKRYNRITVSSFHGVRCNKSLWNCVCDCGKELIVQGSHLIDGHTQSCGCLNKERTSEASIVHGLTGSSEYGAWSRMKDRCFNKNNPDYSRYGGRGITVCDRWKDSFENFYEDMGSCPEGTSLDRIDNNGNYEPANCRWATQLTQMNNIRTNRVVAYQGVVKTVADWARSLGVSYSVLSARLNKLGWSVERAFTTPVRR